MEQQLQAIIELVMGKPGVVAATSAIFAALWQIWKILNERKKEQRRREEDTLVSANTDVMSTLVKIIEIMNASKSTNNNGDKQRIHDLLSHEQTFRADLMNTIHTLQEAKSALEHEKKEAVDELSKVTREYMRMLSYFNTCSRMEDRNLSVFS